jgi:hypothetical protein
MRPGSTKRDRLFNEIDRPSRRLAERRVVRDTGIAEDITDALDETRGESRKIFRNYFRAACVGRLAGRGRNKLKTVDRPPPNAIGLTKHRLINSQSTNGRPSIRRREQRHRQRPRRRSGTARFPAKQGL